MMRDPFPSYRVQKGRAKVVNCHRHVASSNLFVKGNRHEAVVGHKGNGYMTSAGARADGVSKVPTGAGTNLFKQTQLLEPGAVDDLVVNNKLATTVVDDQGANAATALVEGLADLLEQVALVDDRQALLDVARLGHGNDASVIADVQDTVGLVDRAEHGLDDHGRRWVGHEAGLLVELAGEEVDTQVAVLASLGGDGDADHLARTTLEDQEVANADEVAGDRDGVWRVTATGLHDADILAHSVMDTGETTLLGGDELTLLLVVVVVAMEDTISGTLDSAAEGVVFTLVVVVTHFESGVFFENLRLGGFHLDGSSVGGTGGLHVYVARQLGVVVDELDRRRVSRAGGSEVDLVGGLDAPTIFALSDVELGCQGSLV